MNQDNKSVIEIIRVLQAKANELSKGKSKLNIIRKVVKKKIKM